jgi:hypothetical protein
MASGVISAYLSYQALHCCLCAAVGSCSTVAIAVAASTASFIKSLHKMIEPLEEDLSAHSVALCRRAQRALHLMYSVPALICGSCIRTVVLLCLLATAGPTHRLPER